MSYKFVFVSVVIALFTLVTSFPAEASRTLDSRGPYLLIDEGRLIHKIDSSGQTQIFRYDVNGARSAFQRIEGEIASQSLEKGSYKTGDNKAIIDWASMKDGLTYGTIFGPPGEEMFVMETSKFKNKGQPDYEAFKRLCDQVVFIPVGR